MVLHRYFLPTLLGFSLFFSFLHTPVFVGGGIWLQSIGMGILFGVLLSFISASWIKRHQVNGKLRVKWREYLFILSYFAILGIVAVQFTYHLPYNFCEWWSINYGPHCHLGYWLFTLLVDVTFLGSLFIWGLFFERKIGTRLIYVSDWIMKDPEVAKAMKEQQSSNSENPRSPDA